MPLKVREAIKMIEATGGSSLPRAEVIASIATR